MVFFTSDPHYYHTNIIRFCNRPYKTVEEMNEDLIFKHNAMVAPTDTIYYLGDFSLAFRPVELFVNKLNGIKHLIYGNHDFCSHLHPRGKKNPEKWHKAYLDAGFASVQERLIIDIKGQSVLLHHFPYASMENADSTYKVRYLNQRPIDEGLPLLHGHTHGKWLKLGNCIDVGVDAPGSNMSPISEDKVYSLINHIGDILCEY